MPQGQRFGYQIRPDIDPKLLEAIMHAVSVFDTELAARAQNDKFAVRATGSPFTYVAALNVPADSSIACDDAFGNKHDWNLFGKPAEILACVTPPDFEL